MISPDVVGVRACLDARMRADCARLGLCPANIPRRKHAYVAERAMGKVEGLDWRPKSKTCPDRIVLQKQLSIEELFTFLLLSAGGKGQK